MHNRKGVLVTDSRLHSFCLTVMQLFSSEYFDGYIKYRTDKTSEILALPNPALQRDTTWKAHGKHTQKNQMSLPCTFPCGLSSKPVFSSVMFNANS